jgi:hypothetical protein
MGSPLQPRQMQLFMTGRELQGEITKSIDRAPMQSMEGMWKRKLTESKRSGMGHGADTYSSLREHGWQGEGPGLLHSTVPGAIPEWDREELGVTDAHHRIAAAAHMEGLKGKRQRTIFIPTWNRDQFQPEKMPKR